MHESKHGFVPNSADPNAWRLRRRFRLIKGGHPNLALIHYTRGPVSPIIPSLMSQPIRTYPLRSVQEASVFVAGEKAGIKVPPTGPPGPMGMGNMGLPMNIHQQQAMLAQQNNNMEMLDRKRAMTAQVSTALSCRLYNLTTLQQRPGAPGAPPRVDETEEMDDGDFISSRALALARYKRNHDFMNDVFRHAAYRGRFTDVPPAPYSDFDQKELEEKTRKLEAEVEALKAKSGQRREVSFNADVSMEAPITV